MPNPNGRDYPVAERPREVAADLGAVVGILFFQIAP
jgi:hypothetical protein